MDAHAAIDLAASKGAPTQLVHAWRGMAAEDGGGPHGGAGPAGDGARTAARAAREWLHGQDMMRKMTRPLSGLAEAPAAIVSGNPYLTGALVIAVLVGGSYWLDSRRSA